MKDGKGYILPDEPYTEELICLKVWIPKDARYLEAFAGQYHDLGAWLAWQKDGTNRAAIAASVWKAAIDYTYAYGWIGDCMNCEDIWSKLESIQNSIYALAAARCDNETGDKEMCCCCGCNESASDQAINLDEYVDLPPDASDTGATVSDGWKCDASHQIVDNWAEYWQLVGNSLAGGLLLDEALAAAGVFITTMTIATGIIIVIVTGLIALVASVFTDTTKDWFVFHRDSLACILYSSTSPANAKSNVLTYIENFYNVPQGGITANTVKFLLKRTMDMSNWNMLFQENSFSIDSGNVGSNCTACGAPLPDPIPVPLPDPVIAEGLLFSAPNHGVNLTEGGYEIGDGKQAYYNVLYHLRAVYYSGATSSGYRSGIHLEADFANGFDNEVIENLKVHIEQVIGYSGQTNGVELFHVWGLNGMEVWVSDAQIPAEIQAMNKYIATDKNNEFDVLFWFEKVL